MQRLDVVELRRAGAGRTRRRRPHGAVVGHAGVLVADGGGEEFQEAARGGSPASAMIAGTTMRAAAGTRRPCGGAGLTGTISLQATMHRHEVMRASHHLSSTFRKSGRET